MWSILNTVLSYLADSFVKQSRSHFDKTALLSGNDCDVISTESMQAALKS